MAGWLSAIGRATPAITGAMEDIEQRPIRAMRQGWEQEKMGMEREKFGQEREQFGQQKALSEIALNREKAKEETRKEEERLDKAPISLRTHPFFANYLPESKEKIIEMGRKLGLVTGEKGNEETTGRGWKYFQKMVEENDKVSTWLSNEETRNLQKQSDAAFAKYEKVNNDSSATPEDKEKAFKILEAANAAKTGHVKNHDAYISAKKFMDDFKALPQNPAFKSLPIDKKNQIIKAAQDAIATKDFEQYYKARDKAFEEAKQTSLYSTREEAIRSALPVKGYITSAELTDKGWKPHYLPEKEIKEKEDPDADKFSKALTDTRKTEQTPLFMEKLSETEQQRSETRLRNKTKSNYIARGGNPKKFDQFWSKENYGVQVLDKSDIKKLKEFATPEEAISHVERAYRVNMISPEVKDQAMGEINKNRKKWNDWRKQP